MFVTYSIKTGELVGSVHAPTSEAEYYKTDDIGVFIFSGTPPADLSNLLVIDERLVEKDRGQTP